MDKLRVACYVRTSTDFEEQEGSFRIQCDYFTDLICSDARLEFAGCYGDPGCSGRGTKNRHEFNRMIQDCEAHRIDIIYTKSVSRFARSITDLVETVTRLRELGVYVYFERENVNTRDRSSELLLNILGIIAQEESRSLGENVRLGLQARTSTGHPVGKVPYGYRRINSDADWVICEEEASRIRLAFMMASAGERYPDIRKSLDRLETVDNTGLAWTKDRLRRTLTNVAYKGDALTGKVYRINGKIRANHGVYPSYYLEGHHEPIISPDLFDRVQYMMHEGFLKASRCNFTNEQAAFINDKFWLNEDLNSKASIPEPVRKGGLNVSAVQK